MLLSHVAPYTAEDMWVLLGHEPSVVRAGWPAVDEALLVEDTVTAVVQVKGKVRDTLEVFRPEVFDIPLGDLVAATGSKSYRSEHDVHLGLYSRRRLRRQARSLLRPGPPPAHLHRSLIHMSEPTRPC